jgi:probable DNA repair protein
MVYLVGFDEFTPQQSALLKWVGETHEFSLPEYEPATSTVPLRDSTDELRSAAAWARGHLESNAEARIGVIVPDLQRLRSQVERVFSAILHPGLTAPPGRRAFHISIGAALAEVPMVRAAFQILELGRGDVPLTLLGMVLRSPFLAGHTIEQSRRALLDADLRKQGFFRIGIKTVRAYAQGCPLLDAALRNLEYRLEQLPLEQTPSEWSRSFTLLLRAAGWPGDRNLSNEEFQANKAWNNGLSAFATLDLTIGRLSFSKALEHLQQIAQNIVFQPEDQGAPVQVMGLFESSGLRFDHLWVMGLHDEAFPSQARPNPFLPIQLQRAHGLPHSSPARELEVATMLMRRLSTSAPEVVFSYPKQQVDQQLGPSPFLSEFKSAEFKSAVIPLLPTWLDSMKSSSRLEALADGAAPPVPPDSVQTGGASLLKDMAACYFRAWAIHRAKARPLEEPETGISSRASGTATHTALQLIWEQVQTHHALCLLTTAEMEEIVDRSVRAGVAKTKGLGRALEQKRLQALLMAWLQKEKARQAFTVIESEAEHEILLGRLRIKTRFDRVDQLDDGRHIVLDYKTGVLKPGCWSGDRPDEPQLPLYCVSRDHAIAAAAFAQIRCDAMGFKGLEQEPQILPDLGKMDQGPSLSQQITEWRQVLENLSAEFCSGKARVNPKKTACEYCALTALCRVHDTCD